MFFGSYPITPASPILHALARLKEFGVTTFQAEDEIAAICSAIGASYAGQLGVTSSSGPGIALKGEALGLAIITELPLVIVNSQRGGPSTGLPTKTEQSDLYQAVYGRNGDAPLVVLATRSPSDCFEVAIEACRLADHIHDAGHGSDRRLYRQRRRAVARARHGVVRAVPGDVPHRRCTAAGHVNPYAARPRHARAHLDQAQHPRPDPPDRRHREVA